MSQSNILRLNAGAINKVNDTYIGTVGAPNGGPLRSHFAGQLGKAIELDDDNLVFDSSMGTVYGGSFRYVQLAAAAGAVVVGQIVFWDPTATPANWVVTTSESGTTDAGVYPAGIVLNSGWTASSYSVIQYAGLCYTQFRGTLTDAGAIGSAVYCAGVGGADLGFADVLSDANPTAFSDVALLQRRFLGTAYEAPTSGGLKRVDLNFRNIRG